MFPLLTDSLEISGSMYMAEMVTVLGLPILYEA
jgi:hypothetical protein